MWDVGMWGCGDTFNFSHFYFSAIKGVHSTEWLGNEYLIVSLLLTLYVL